MLIVHQDVFRCMYGFEKNQRILFLSQNVTFHLEAVHQANSTAYKTHPVLLVEQVSKNPSNFHTLLYIIIQF